RGELRGRGGRRACRGRRARHRRRAQPLRVLVASDAMAGLGPRSASEVIATAFAQQGAQVAVIPLGSGGDALADALSTIDSAAELVVASDMDELLGSIVAGESPLYLDLTGLAPVPLAGLVAAATPEVVGNLRRELGGRPVAAVVPDDGADAPLTGLSGMLAELGRRRGAELSETISEDTRAEKWTAATG